MNMTKHTGHEFLSAVRPKKIGEVTVFPRKQDIFDALIEARGANVSLEHLPPVSDSPIINGFRGKTAHINAIKSEIKIQTNSSDVTDSHYVDIALDAYINAGGKFENFAKEFSAHREEYESKHQNMSPQIALSHRLGADCNLPA